MTWSLLLLMALDGGSAGRVAATRVVDASIAPRELDPVVDALQSRLAQSGFDWREAPCGLQPEPIACLRGLQPDALLFATLARVGDALVLTVADRQGLVGRFDAPVDGRRLAGDFARFLTERYPGQAAGVIRSQGPLPSPSQVQLDGRELGRVDRGTHVELRWVSPGPHELSLTAPNRVAEPVRIEVAPGATSQVQLRLRRVRTRSRLVHLLTAGAALAAGAGLFAAGAAASNCDVLSDQPVGACPDAFRPEVDPRIAGATAVGFGAGLGATELLLDRRQSAWIPLLVGLAVGGASTAAAFAGY